MERLGPDVILRSRIAILQRKYDALIEDCDRQKRLVNHWRARHYEMRVSRDGWREKAKNRRRRIHGLEQRLATLNPEHPFHASHPERAKRLAKAAA